MAESNGNIQSWPDLAIGLYEQLTGKGAVISYEFENFVIGVPREVGSDDVTNWKISGKLKISTTEK
jgi:hypothetical protein